MSAASFKTALDEVLRAEGGYVNHPRDPGGCTNLGITLATLRTWRQNAAATCADLKALRREEAADIYREQYWHRVWADDLPAGLDLIIFDHAVNAGPAPAVRLLQARIGANPDGRMGPLTLKAVAARDPLHLIADYADARRAFYRSLKHFDTFGRGWLARVDRAELVATLLAHRTAGDLHDYT